MKGCDWTAGLWGRGGARDPGHGGFCAFPRVYEHVWQEPEMTST